MQKLIDKLVSVDECRNFITNALERGKPEYVQPTRIRMLEILAGMHSESNVVEQDCLKAIYAYEMVLSDKNQKKTRASRTWQAVKKHGVIMAVQSFVERSRDSSGFALLKSLGLTDYSFENIVLKYPDYFSVAAYQCASDKVNNISQTLIKTPDK
jgi:hypothetical protein